MSRTRRTEKESPSKKLRAIFYNLWEQNKEGFTEFDPYYDNKMYKLISHYKKLLKKK